MRQRPHTRTQCQDQQQGNQCPECREPACPPAGGGSNSIPSQHTSSPSTSVTSTQTTSVFAGGGGLGGSAIPKDDPFIAPISTVSRGRATVSVSSTSVSLPNEAGGTSKIRVTLLTELPAEILFKILSYMSFKEISHLRTVSNAPLIF